MYGYLVDQTMHLANVKIHTDFVKQHAGDLLLFSLVEIQQDLERMLAGGRRAQCPGFSFR